MSDKIILTPGATAEPGTCGSCKFFERQNDGGEYYRMYGRCKFTFPKKMVQQWAIREIDPKWKNREYTGNEDRIKDDDRCDLQRPDGKTYIVQRIIAPVKP